MANSRISELEAQKAIYAKLIEYRSDPIGFMTEVLDVKPEHVWPKMREVVESVRDHQLTAVPAGHSVSKTYSAARIAVWFKTCYQPSTIISTAPSDNQVRNQLWREIHQTYGSAKVPLGGKMTKLLWDCIPSKETLERLTPAERGLWEKNFAIGFSTSPDSISEQATKMHGWHNKWILVILDEAAGILPPIWTAALDALIVNERCKMLAIGNPTDPYSDFADACKNEDWNVVPVSMRDTPNYKEDREVIPNLADRKYESKIIKKFGEYSNEHKFRCLGRFPDFAQGVIYGPEMGVLEKNKWIGDYAWDPKELVYTFGDYGVIYTAIGFFQFPGDKIKMIDYWYDDIGVGIPAICKMFDTKPYNYDKDQGHWGGPDMHPKHGSNRKSLATGLTIINEFARLNHRMNVCMPHSFDDGVKITRDVLALLRIDSLRCMDFVDAIKQYKFKKNIRYSTDEKPAYSEDPEPTPSRHPADMLRHLSMVFRNQLTVDGARIGLSYQDRKYKVDKRAAIGTTNLMQA